MDPMVQKKIEQIDGQLAGLRETLEKNRAELVKQHKEKGDLLQDQWTDKKKITTLDRVQKEYDALQAENRRYAKERKELREQLAGLLTLTKSLRISFRA